MSDRPHRDYLVQHVEGSKEARTTLAIIEAIDALADRMVAAILAPPVESIAYALAESDLGNRTVEADFVEGAQATAAAQATVSESLDHLTDGAETTLVVVEGADPRHPSQVDLGDDEVALGCSGCGSIIAGQHAAVGPGSAPCPLAGATS